jgi:hypothetical protein
MACVHLCRKLLVREGRQHSDCCSCRFFLLSSSAASLQLHNLQGGLLALHTSGNEYCTLSQSKFCDYASTPRKPHASRQVELGLGLSGRHHSTDATAAVPARSNWRGLKILVHNSRSQHRQHLSIVGYQWWQPVHETLFAQPGIAVHAAGCHNKSILRVLCPAKAPMP